MEKLDESSSPRTSSCASLAQGPVSMLHHGRDASYGSTAAYNPEYRRPDIVRVCGCCACTLVKRTARRGSYCRVRGVAAAAELDEIA